MHTATILCNVHNMPQYTLVSFREYGYYEFKLRSQPSANKMVGYSDTTIRDGCIECTMHDVFFFGGLATYCTPSPSSHLRLTSVPSCSSSSSSDLCFPVRRRHWSRSSGRSSFSRESFASNVGTEHRSHIDRHNHG